jgi:hypothetical protein
MSNKRIFYACQAIEITPIDKDGVKQTAKKPKGVQSVGMNTNFNLEKIFQLGQLDLYDNIENNPEVEITINKVFDGTIPVYLLAMGGGAVTGNISDFANNRADVKLGIYSDTGSLASGTALHTVTCTGMYVSSVSFTFPTDGNATEDVTLVGNDKTWAAGGLSAFVQSSGPETAPATARRWKFDKAGSVFPSGAGGIGSGVIQSVTVSADFGRESIYELGSYVPYHRYVNFPVEVTSEIEVIATTGDYLDISESTYSCTGTGQGRVQDKEIKFKLCGSGVGAYLEVDLGKKNKITSVNYQGGDTGGGNATITYSFTTDNYLKVTGAGSYADTATATA